jgi:hypothetical protein
MVGTRTIEQQTSAHLNRARTLNHPRHPLQPHQTWEGHTSGAAPQPIPISRLLGAAADLVLSFPSRSYEVVVSVARKVRALLHLAESLHLDCCARLVLCALVDLDTVPTMCTRTHAHMHHSRNTRPPQTDAALWPALFTAVGSPSALLQHLLDNGALMSAGKDWISSQLIAPCTCYQPACQPTSQPTPTNRPQPTPTNRLPACFLIVVDRLEGPHLAQSLALRLIRQTLRRGQYELCAEILRFMMPPGFRVRGPTPGVDRSNGKVTIGGAGGGKAGRMSCGPSPQQRAAAQEEAARRGGKAGGSWLGWLWGGGGGGADQGRLQSGDLGDGDSWRGGSGRLSSSGGYRQSLVSALQSASSGGAGLGGGNGSGSSGGWEGLSAGSAGGAEEACHRVSDHAWMLLEQVGGA